MTRVFGLIALDGVAMILECSQQRHHFAEQFHQPVIGFGLRGQILKLANELWVLVNLCHTPIHIPLRAYSIKGMLGWRAVVRSFVPCSNMARVVGLVSHSVG